MLPCAESRFAYVAMKANGCTSSLLFSARRNVTRPTSRQTGVSASFCGLVRADAVEVRVGADEDPSSGDRERGTADLAERIAGKNGELPAGCEDHRFTLLV